VGKEKQRALKEDTTWFDRASSMPPPPSVRPNVAIPKAPALPARPPLLLVEGSAAERYVTCVPLIPLKAAAGAFSATQPLDDGDCEWVELTGRTRAAPGLFVAQVIGESMNRRIPNGAWCLWRANPPGSRQGKVVLAQHREIDDLELGGRYTVKIYESNKVATGDGGWRHSVVRLKPDSMDPSFEPIVLQDLDDGELRIVAELVEVLPKVSPMVSPPYDPECFDPRWVELLDGLVEVGVMVEPGGDVEVRGRVIGSYEVLATLRGRQLYLLREGPDATDVSKAIQQDGRRALIVNPQAPDAVNAILAALKAESS
jgi:hypothetical protein